jgi:hypothetical protein
MALEDPHTPFKTRADASLVDGQFNARAGFAIPPGTLLVAQFMSVHVMLPPGQTPQVSFNADSGAVGGFIPLHAGGVTSTPFGPLAVFVAALPILDYRTDSFAVDLSRSSPTVSAAPGPARLSAFVSGFTVPA